MSPLLEVRGLSAGYGRLTVVRDVDLTAAAGTVTALLGPNGAGKSTLLATLAGLLPRSSGSVLLNGEPLRGGQPARTNRAGVVLVPDTRALFTALTVEENISLAARRGGPGVADMIEVFPSLDKRRRVRAGALSGGEQQMLAVARALVQQPKVLLIDEMSMGLAPVIVENLLPVVRRVADTTGAAVLLVEQHVRLALELADEALVLVHGQVTLRGPAREIAADQSSLEHAYLGPTRA